MLDISKLLAGLVGGGQADPLKPMVDPTVKLDPQILTENEPIKVPSQTPSINPGQTPDISAAPPPLTAPMPNILPPAPAEKWKQGMMGGLQGLQSAIGSQSKAPAPPPMDMGEIKQLQFAHQRNGGIIPPRGRY